MCIRLAILCPVNRVRFYRVRCTQQQCIVIRNRATSMTVSRFPYHLPNTSGVLALLAVHIVMVVCSVCSVNAQGVDFTINTLADTQRISPYVYGTNAQSDDRDENIAARRLGGNRLTGYNWENNASNAGADYLHHSDNYLTGDLPSTVQNVPSIVLTRFHDSSLATGCYSLVTLPAAGFVARDKNGTVEPGQTAPSARWVRVVESKGAAYSNIPDTADDAVYVDEEVHALVARYGMAATGTGVRGYAVDNEPALWPSTHPRIHPAKPTITEMINRTSRLAAAVKGVDSSAEIFAAVAYGFAEYRNFQDASDWSQYASYGTYLDAFLAKMKEASVAAGRRLVDVLDLHWYPEAQGPTLSGGWERIALNANHDPGVAWARMQAPRTLWDSTYVEHSWIGQYFSPVALLPALKQTLARYPGTRLAFTEFDYGGDDHISGGIALADVLGIFGAHGVYMSNHWGAVGGYLSAAYKLYRNYDGYRSTFGNLHVRSHTSDAERTMVHAALDSIGRLHIIAINRDTAQAIDATISIVTLGHFRQASVYGFDRQGPTIRPFEPVASVPDNRFVYRMPAMSALHMVLEPMPTGEVPGGALEFASGVSCTPNPARDAATIRFALDRREHVIVSLVDVRGGEALRALNTELDPGAHAVPIDLQLLPPGAYVCVVRAGGRASAMPLMISR